LGEYIQYSATFSYVLLKNGSPACAALCLTSSTLRRQVSLSEDITEPGGKCGVVQLVMTRPSPGALWPAPAEDEAAGARGFRDAATVFGQEGPG
jgi:hypothetical protein